MGMSTIPRVALLIETARGYGRDVLRGVVRYARLHEPWSFYLTPGDFKQAMPKIKQWGGTGIIARIETPEIGKALLATNVPIVALDLSQSQLGPRSPFRRCSELSSDSRRAAQLAAEHLLDRGFQHFAFVGIAGRIWSQRREEAFCDAIREAGFEPHVYSPPRRRADRHWYREQTVLEDWLRDLPQPVGLMACNDDRGRQLMEACRGAGVQVPEQAAVIGVDNDELLCELCAPPLSSVAINAARGGFEAAALLAGLMFRRIRKPGRIVAPALHVVTRRSTEISRWMISRSHGRCGLSRKLLPCRCGSLKLPPCCPCLAARWRSASKEPWAVRSIRRFAAYASSGRSGCSRKPISPWTRSPPAQASVRPAT